MRRLWVEKGSRDRDRSSTLGVAHRPRAAAAGDDGLVRGRRGDRGGRREEHAEKILKCALLAGERPAPTRRAEARARHRAPAATSREGAASFLTTLAKALRRARLLAGGDQPARSTTKDGRRAGARREDRTSTRTRSSATPSCSRCATSNEEDAEGGRGLASTTSPTSRSTATSAAWSTAPASRWRRWT